MENACFDRLHSDKHHATPLEYNSGIQQHLTSLDFAYKSIRKAFGLDKPKTYVTLLAHIVPPLSALCLC